MTDATTLDRELLLPVGTRLVHIGPPKTGTTSLQGAFHRNREAILAQGVRYAGRARHSGAAVLAVTERPAFSQDSGSPAVARWTDLAREARNAREPRVVVSSEFFADALPRHLPRIIEDLGGDPVQIVVTLRPLARIIPSQWQQFVQSGLRTAFEPWLDTMFNRPPRVEDQVFWRRHRHDLLVARWAGVVGPDRLSVIVMDEHDHDRLFRVFEALLALSCGTLVPDQDLANRSMTWPEIEAVRAFNVQFKDEDLGNALFHKVMHFSAATHMKRHEPDPSWPRVELPGWALERATTLQQEMIESIRASGVRIIGDLDTLAASQGRPPEGPPAEIQVPPDVAARMAMGVLIASGLARRRSDGTISTTREGRRQEPPEFARASTRQITGVVVRRVRDRVAGRLQRVRRTLHL